jgi:hypothetical protein
VRARLGGGELRDLVFGEMRDSSPLERTLLTD